MSGNSGGAQTRNDDENHQNADHIRDDVEKGVGTEFDFIVTNPRHDRYSNF
jgi:16S rRNA G1207 methylase RsmC